MARLFELSTPLGDALRFHRMRVSETLSCLPEIEIRALSERTDIDPGELLGKSVTVKVNFSGGEERFYNGYVVRLATGGAQGRLTAYHLSVRPWLWFLSRTADCRIFQDQTVPEIVAQVLDDEPSKKFDDRLSEPDRYKRWEYCVQYRETDFDFVSRLLEQEGIYWFFEHADGEHTLVLIDYKGKHQPIEWGKTIRFVSRAGRQVVDEDIISDWQAVQEIQPGEYRLTDYNFKTPTHDLGTRRLPEVEPEHAKSSYEVFDFPGDYDTHDEGEAYVASRIEEVHTRARSWTGSGRLRSFHVGRSFTFADHPRDDQNGEYLITSTEYEFTDPGFESTDAAEGSGYRCTFTAIRAEQQFRPQRSTARPLIHGIQSAVVTGPAGEEIHTDEYGRIKVQFHWDRYGKKDEHTSCWLRVAFLAAGGRFGFVSIPRIGHEVIVSFLEGDPDRPLVTGVVYNASNMPPWELPANKTQSGLLTRSSVGAGAANANAIRFEDRKGEEQVWLHAEKNQDIEVENDETHWVGNDRTKTIDNDETTHVKHDRTETVGNDETITIHGNRTETVDKEEKITIHGGRTEEVDRNESITIHGARTETVDKDETITIHGGRTEKVDKNETIAIDGARTETVAKDETITINGGRTEKVVKDETITISGSRTEAVTKDESVGIGGQRAHSVAKTDSLNVGKTLTINAGDAVTITTGSASISMKKDGTIVIKGKDITIDGSGKINIKASSDIVMKGSKILQN